MALLVGGHYTPGCCPGLRSLTLSGYLRHRVIETPFIRSTLIFYTQLVAVKVVAIAVRMVITTLRILPQRVLLLKVPIVV